MTKESVKRTIRDKKGHISILIKERGELDQFR